MMWKGFGSSAGQGETTLIAHGAVIDGSILAADILTYASGLSVSGRFWVMPDNLASCRLSSLLLRLSCSSVHGLDGRFPEL